MRLTAAPHDAIGARTAQARADSGATRKTPEAGAAVGSSARYAWAALNRAHLRGANAFDVFEQCSIVDLSPPFSMWSFAWVNAALTAKAKGAAVDIVHLNFTIEQNLQHAQIR